MWIVRKNKPVAVIIPPPKQGETLRQAVSDLTRIVRRSTGARIPVRRSGQDGGSEIRLCIERVPENGKSDLTLHDSFRIACRGDVLTISGAGERALAYGVYEFLEQAVGVRWFFPGPLGEDIPSHADISWRPGSRVYRPSFAWRAVSGEFPGWTLNHKLSAFPVIGGHAYRALLPETMFKKHPEYFSMIYGKRRKWPTQICHSAPGMVDRAMAYIEEQFEKKPDAKAVSFGPSDMGFFCECKACRAQDDITRHYDYYVNEQPYGYGGPMFAAHNSERIYRFTNRVAERFAEKYPEKYLIVFAYGSYRFPPENMKIRDNVIIWLTHTCVGMHNPERRKAEIDMIRRWRAVARHVVIFEALANQCWPCLPREVSELVEDQFRILKRNGVEGYFTQMWGDFSTNLPSYYLAARLSWDASRKRDAELGEMYSRCFGPASKHVADYYAVFADAWRVKTADGGIPWARSVISTQRQHGICWTIFTPAVMKAARAALERAKKAAGKGLYGRRVAFIEAGLLYTELMMSAVRECMALEEMYIPILYHSPWGYPRPYPFDCVKALLIGNCDRRLTVHACERALSAFDKVEKFAAKYKGKYVLSPDIMKRSESRWVRDNLREILRLAKSPKLDRELERKMFVTHEI